MSYKALKTNKLYSVPGKQISWVWNKNVLSLETELDWVKYKEGKMILPPIELGRCTDWHFELSPDARNGKFIASWDIRRVKDKIHLIDYINNNINDFALDLT